MEWKRCNVFQRSFSFSSYFAISLLGSKITNLYFFILAEINFWSICKISEDNNASFQSEGRKRSNYDENYVEIYSSELFSFVAALSNCESCKISDGCIEVNFFMGEKLF